MNEIQENTLGAWREFDHAPTDAEQEQTITELKAYLEGRGKDITGCRLHVKVKPSEDNDDFPVATVGVALKEPTR